MEETKLTMEEVKQKVATLVETYGFDPEKDKKSIAAHLGLTLTELKDMYKQDRQERLLKKAELTSEELLDIDLDSKDIERKYGKQKVAVMKIMQAEAQFIRETLGKDAGYSKRNELTGKNGEEIKIKEILFHAPIENTKS